ncbi:efflux RND transporter periplasmic adaptor subunit [Flavobacterium silvisoli]|uniref:Efflux RND transporter periplasmic adaptor subunit n=1 Tax=Flavobacterium silvisoli TaxID=2529433 RepID=A0A4Q9Z292_9FLAO|nr:efflux RND transporter periplasmic adaptor subunit [Flavobacterium silvisoli]TBX70282.1 efflux RND transporter periplasmic adaptor subunit [Flavobacterium silvisoli]
MKRNVIFTGLVAMLCLVSCTTKKEEKEEITKFTVTNAAVIDTSFTKDYVSQIRSVRNIEIRAQEKGFLQNIYVDEGQYVTAGQVLFRIMPQLYEAELQRAEAEAKAAGIELQNAKMLADKNVVSKSEQAMAQAKFEQAKAEVAMAKLHLSFTEIRAPFSGTIDRIPKKLGSLIDEGELLTSLSDNTKMFAYFNVSEPEYINYQNNAKLHNNDNVGLVLANGDLLKYKGKVEVIEGEFDNETGNIAFRASFPNPDKLLRNGETGKVQMTIPVKNAIIIPQKATYEIQDQKYVFIVAKDGTVKSRNIKVAYELPDIYILDSGLSADERFLVEGIQKVKDDQKVETKFEDPKKVLQSLKLKAD